MSRECTETLEAYLQRLANTKPEPIATDFDEAGNAVGHALGCHLVSGGRIQEMLVVTRKQARQQAVLTKIIDALQYYSRLNVDRAIRMAKGALDDER